MTKPKIFKGKFTGIWHCVDEEGYCGSGHSIKSAYEAWITYKKAIKMTEDIKEKFLTAYIKAVDKIQDHFEYANESLKDRAFIHKVLAELTENLSKVNENNNPRA